MANPSILLLKDFKICYYTQMKRVNGKSDSLSYCYLTE